MRNPSSVCRLARSLPFEAYVVDRPLSSNGCYQMELDRDFPFAVKPFRYSASDGRRPFVWHTYMEVFVPLNTACRFQMGNEVVELSAGDLLVVDHLKPHVVLDFAVRNLQAIVIRFLPEVILGLSAPSVDYQLLAPFYYSRGDGPRVLRAHNPHRPDAHRALARLLECHFDIDHPQYARTGSKVYFLELLYRLARCFELSEVAMAGHWRQQQRSSRMRKVLEYVNKGFANRITVSEAAALAAMSESKFMRAFKQTTGMTWVTYVTHVRLVHAMRLLKESDLSICEIANTVGFADQSYFDTRFKQNFGLTPLRYRNSTAGDLPVHEKRRARGHR